MGKGNQKKNDLHLITNWVVVDLGDDKGKELLSNAIRQMVSLITVSC